MLTLRSHEAGHKDLSRGAISVVRVTEFEESLTSATGIWMAREVPGVFTGLLYLHYSTLVVDDRPRLWKVGSTRPPICQRRLTHA